MDYVLKRLAFIVLAVAFLVLFGERKSGATERGVGGPVGMALSWPR